MPELTCNATQDTSFLGHPKGLMVIFFTEMWERFGYYGMRALLVLYLTKAFLFTDTKAYAIYGAFTAFVYITPIVGGILADKYIGFRLGTIYGCITMAAGYFMLAIPQLEQSLFYCALALVAIGNGLFKPNTSSLVGELYSQKDNRKDAAYTIFYMGINIGSVFAPLMCGYIGEVYGWSYGFGLTGVGLLVGLGIFKYGQPHLGSIGIKHSQTPFLHALVFLGIIMTTPIVASILSGSLTGDLLVLTGVITLAYILIKIQNISKDERKEVYGLLCMMFFCSCFFACYEQAGSSMNLFTDRNINRELSFQIFGTFFEFEIPTSAFQAVNPFFIILLAPIVAKLWDRLREQHIEPRAPIKFAIGLFLASVGFFVLSISTSFANSQGLVSVFWLLGGYFFMTLGELALSPVSLAITSKHAPKKMLGLLMGSLMLSYAFGNYVAALLAKLASAPEFSGALEPVSTLPIYKFAFNQVGLFALVFAGLILVLTPIINRLLYQAPEPETQEQVA